MSDWMGLVWLVVLLAANAFFVGAEFAIIAAKRSSIEPRAEEGETRARRSLWAMEHATLMLAATQLGITICSLLILNVSEPAVHELLHIPLSVLPVGDGFVDVLAFVITLVLVSFLHVVLGEMVPKNLTLAAPERAVLLLAPPLLRFERVFKPFVVVLNAGADAVLRLFGIQPQHAASTAYTLDEVATIVAESKREGMLTDSSNMLTKAFEFTTKTAGDVAVPRSDLVTLDEHCSPRDLEGAVTQHGFSRYVLTDAAGDLVGYIHLKDIIDIPDDRFSAPLPPQLVRALTSVQADAELEDAMLQLQRLGAHVARVLDASGEVVSVLFFEDIIEVLVGEIDDATQIG
jgi:CBS domain containing-hemolysin-like protein